jgi:hypothetical protein
MSATVEITRLLRTSFPQHGPKRVARLSGRSVRTVQAWFAARCVPSSEDLLRMARANDALRAELIRSLEGQHDDTRQMVLPLDGAPLPSRGHAAPRRGGTLAKEG